MSVGWRCFWWCMAGFQIGGTLVNFSPGDPWWQPLRVVLTLLTLAIPTAGHWLMARYRVRIERSCDDLTRDAGA